ncbi:hypothetical protein NQ318_004240 [Aromia moschata]|uniref:HTH psq-type domain-containing protein n=1 Tax=Aromia moschata TaxID=1265417 RepID=A0AAV8Y6N2_9CUCU|nr:hypothetical protein NQ318_004240 [Aromia moschata]
MSSQAQKRKHKTLTIKEKSDILDRLNRNEFFSSFASEYGIGRSTIYDIKKNHEKIKNFVSTTDCGPGKRHGFWRHSRKLNIQRWKKLCTCGFFRKETGMRPFGDPFFPRLRQQNVQ